MNNNNYEYGIDDDKESGLNINNIQFNLRWY